MGDFRSFPPRFSCFLRPLWALREEPRLSSAEAGNGASDLREIPHWRAVGCPARFSFERSLFVGIFRRNASVA